MSEVKSTSVFGHVDEETLHLHQKTRTVQVDGPTSRKVSMISSNFERFLAWYCEKGGHYCLARINRTRASDAGSLLNCRPNVDANSNGCYESLTNGSSVFGT
jgi:hypothetical protein